MQQYGAVIWPTPDQQSRYDVEFLGRMLGLRSLAGNASYSHTAAHVESVARAMADPVANARARQRIGDLLAQCEWVEHAATQSERFGDSCRAQLGRLPPLDSQNHEHSPRHFTRPN